MLICSLETIAHATSTKEENQRPKETEKGKCENILHVNSGIKMQY